MFGWEPASAARGGPGGAKIAPYLGAEARGRPERGQERQRQDGREDERVRDPRRSQQQRDDGHAARLEEHEAGADRPEDLPAIGFARTLTHLFPT